MVEFIDLTAAIRRDVETIRSHGVRLAGGLSGQCTTPTTLKACRMHLRVVQEAAARLAAQLDHFSDRLPANPAASPFI